ncbi:indoleamine 2,3-dioxygenase gamma type [Pseudoneurospora amorphoporcata]|uniref:Indoleamine 2,3-dioxygenase gamma type n=1 Tax=Pseudoneurospora amorphoporcata TaxID=241081 RepID=A0AAN6P4B1_9PEZI|nr:indoleamine 2,3-dioxygenase gamma type [Pseudoneurospora amorphoporcata]
MGSLEKDTATYDNDFPILYDPRPDDGSLPAFMVSTTRGFLPRMEPIVTLPSEFDPLESILQRMPVKTASGEPGLLAQGKGLLGEAVHKELPDLTEFVDKYRHDLPLMNALYRDYSFLASAYLLEPCHERFVKGEEYGLGRQVLPANVARPIAKCAEICEFKPFMEYAGSYALFNYRLVDPSLGFSFSDPSNVRLIRAFENGLDPTSSEAGFVLVHIDMVRHSGPLVAGAVASLDLCRSALSSSSTTNPVTRLHVSTRQSLNMSLSHMLAALKKVNATMETMWKRSKPNEYTSFRTFIFGIKSQSMFPNGVVYDGLPGSEGKPLSFRGESGANDSMIPLMDNFLQIPMPDTPLTKILEDFRSYRPSNHRAFLEWVKRGSEEAGLRRWALALDGTDNMTEEERDEVKRSRSLWIQMLNQVREFRWRHWCFAREYILKQTSHPTATGGSPIVTWLPNQLQAVLGDMVGLYERMGGDEAGGLGEECKDIMELVRRQDVTLKKEVMKFCEERGVPRA